MPSETVLVSDLLRSTVGMVGREAELQQLQGALDKALRGERQVVFLSGEPGIGKTTVVEAFVEQLATQHGLWITRGQCVEHYGAGEAYLPVLEALGRLGRGQDKGVIVATLAQYAPTWLVQLPALINPVEREGLQQTLIGTTRERMLREVTEALEMLTTKHPLIVVLEDLHWSDVSTVELLNYVAQRRGPARLLVLGTYRPTEVLVSNHPLKGAVQGLQGRGYGQEIRLQPLPEPEIKTYLTQRFANADFPAELARVIHQWTDGNPLFMTTVVEHLLREGIIETEDGQWVMKQPVSALALNIPHSVRQLIEKQFEALTPDEQQVLEGASAAGAEFAVAAVAAALAREGDEVEEHCANLAARGHFLYAAGVEEWPDGTMSGRYGFVHALYQNVVYERVAEARRIWFHRRIGERKETAYGKQVEEVAGELAAHFAAGRDTQRAVRYSGQAANTAVRRYAHQEAVAHLDQGLTLLQLLPDTPERAQQELRLQLALGEQLTTLKGFGVQEVEQAFARARELCRQLGETPELLRVLLGLWAFYVERAELSTARELAEQLLRLAQHVQSTRWLVWAHLTLGITLHFAGEQIAARQHLEQSLALYDPQHFRGLNSSYDPGVFAPATLGPVLWLLGYPSQALIRSQEGLTLAQDLRSPYNLAYALTLAARTQWLCGERHAVRTQQEMLTSLCREQGFASYLALSAVVRGWLLTEQGQREAGIQQMRQGLSDWRATGAESARPYYLALLAETYGKVGQPQEGLVVLDECWEWMDKTGGRIFEAELYRLYGELSLRIGEPETATKESENRGRGESETSKREHLSSSPIPGFSGSPVLFSSARFPVSSPEEAFQKAIEIAQKQQAKSLELRAVMSLARLWQRQGKPDEARSLVEDIYEWFTEGYETRDLQEAEALLRALGSTVERKQRTDTTQPPHTEPPRRVSIAARDLEIVETETVGDISPMTRSQSPTSNPQPLVPNPQVSECLFRQEGEYWTLVFEGSVCRIKDMRGMQYLAHLLQHPEQEFHALTLVTGGGEATLEFATGEQTSDEAEPLAVFTDAGEVLDPQARVAYKRRLGELRAELEEAQTFNDLGRAEKLQDEIDFLIQELTRAVGLGGRARKVDSPVERARVNVTRAIKTAIRKITEGHPALGQYLTQTIKTGTFCSYIPDPLLPTSWQV